MLPAVLAACIAAVNWQHPAGLITEDTLAEVRDKLAHHDWARQVYETEKARVDPWVAVPGDQLRTVFPTICGNVYHNFSCPDCRTRLHFDPFNAEGFHCDTCGKDFPPDTDAGVYPTGDKYHDTMYHGWACLFYQTAASRAMDMAIMGRVDDDQACIERAVELLLLFADTITGLPTDRPDQGQFSRILTYHREGDNKILNDLAVAYELLRGGMKPEERERVEHDVLRRMLEDGMLEPVYTYNHNNVYQWHRTILQTALALEREDLIDWSFGYGAHDPEQQPEHHSLRRVIATHFKPDGAYWELCSGYHLYPLYHFCELAVLSRNLSRMDPERFPAGRYDFTHPESEGGKVIKNALEWFVSMAMPDRTMTIVGDSTVPRSGLDSYAMTAEVGYRYFDVRAVGDYDALRQGKRSWLGLLYGAPEITQQPTTFTSSYLSSGWVSLRNEWEANRVWVGLNALLPGGGHQHSDRLTLSTYSHGKLLALEKATPYNEAVTRRLGTLSPSHNTVTVDMKSSKQGEALAGDEIPEVATFFSGAFLKFAELRADHLYPQTKVYRRSVAVIEDVVIDLFEVEGGTTHDWILHHAGSASTLSIPLEPGDFEPQEWLANGADRVFHAETDGDWSAQWQLDDVTSRLTMLAAEHTHVYTLETYPIGNAMVTPDHPPCQTLCVRRRYHAPFLAVWDAWRDTPNLQSVQRIGQGNALYLKTRSNAYCILFGAGLVDFPGGLALKSDAAVAVLKNDAAVAYAGGTRVHVMTPRGQQGIRLSERGSAEADWSQDRVVGDKVMPIHYDTYGGQDHRRPSAHLAITFEGDLSAASLLSKASASR